MSSELDINAQMDNLTHDVQDLVQYSSYPSVWSLIKSRIHRMVIQAVQRANTHFTYSTTRLDNFKQRIESLLGDPLDHVAAGHPMGMGNHTIHRDVEGAITLAFEDAASELNDVNGTDVAANASQTFKDSFIHTLDSEIEMNVFSQVFTNATGYMKGSDDDTDFFHKMPIKDETMFVALVCMGVIVPIIFITLLIIFFYMKRKDSAERRREMLLRDQPEFSMDEYLKDERHEEEEVPDLDLKMMNV